jgi:hypothetical protein
VLFALLLLQLGAAAIATSAAIRTPDPRMPPA